jgi:hypothetical protein
MSVSMNKLIRLFLKCINYSIVATIELFDCFYPGNSRLLTPCISLQLTGLYVRNDYVDALRLQENNRSNSQNIILREGKQIMWGKCNAGFVIRFYEGYFRHVHVLNVLRQIGFEIKNKLFRISDLRITTGGRSIEYSDLIMYTNY